MGGFNGRRFLVVTKSPNHSQRKMGMMIPTDSIEVINGFEDRSVVIYYKFKGELQYVDVEESFSDIMNGKCTIEL